MPLFSPAWALEVQARGWEAHGERFRFLGHELRQFGRSPLESRQRHRNGDLSFAAPPAVSGDLALFSGTASPELLRFRLGQDLVSPFADYRFDHPCTRWYNIASRIGMRAHFSGNADRLLAFFGFLVSRRLTEGSRPLLIAKRRFVQDCARALTRALEEIHPTDLRIVTAGWDQIDLSAPDVVPLINFGMIGTNLFEEFNCAYTLTGFYVNEEVVDSIVQDVRADDYHIPLVVRTEGNPRRRRARAAEARHRHHDVDRLAQLALDHQERDVVLQAVGRVRPYTRAREIITIQCAAHPHRPYDREFASLEEAREFFGVPTLREWRRDRNGHLVRGARRSGLTQVQAAARLGLGIATVKRHWKLP
jgi:hypothetical protein